MILAALAILVFICLSAMLLWRLAVYALPLWCGGLAAMTAHQAGTSLFGAFLIGLGAAILTLALGMILLSAVRSPWLRAGVGLTFAVPAGIAGYHAALGLAKAFGVAGWEQMVVTVLAALMTAGAAWSGTLRPSAQPRPAAPVKT